MSEAIVEPPQCYRKHNVGLNGVLPNPLQPSAHSEHTSFELDDHTNNIAMAEATGAALEHTTHSLRSTPARSRRWDAFHIPGEGTATAHELTPREVAQRTRSRGSQPPRGQSFNDRSEERIGREVFIVRRCNDHQNSLQTPDRDTVIPQPSVRGRSVSSFYHGEMRPPHSQATDANVSNIRRTLTSGRQGRTVARDVPYTRVRVASAPRSHAREAIDTRSHGREVSAPAARGREASGPARNSREVSTTGEHGNMAGDRQPFPRLRHRSLARETNLTHSHSGEASVPIAHGREAEGPARNGRGTSVTDEDGEITGGRQPCPRLRPRTSTDRHQRRGMRRNSSNEEREPYSLRPRAERPTYIANTLNRRRNQPNWRSQLRTQMRQYMDEIFAAYVNAMLFGNQKREVKDLPEVAINEEQVQSGLKCSVCLLDFVLDEIVYKLPCEHVYHKTCIIPWLEQNDNCPMCRRPVEDDESGDDDDILPEADDDDDDDDSSNQRAHFRILVGDADVTVIAHDSGNESSSASDSDFEFFMNSDDY